MIIKKQTKHNKMHQNAISLFNSYLKTTKKLKKLQNYKLFFLSVFLNKKLTYLRYYYKKKYYTPSFGQILGKRFKIIKYFKKSTKSVGIVINLFNKKYKKVAKSIFLLYCKNYNLKNYLFLKKYYYLVNPEVGFFLASRS
jgi:hypothetical protein